MSEEPNSPLVVSGKVDGIAVDPEGRSNTSM
jgi:hypothetical protein